MHIISSYPFFYRIISFFTGPFGDVWVIVAFGRLRIDIIGIL
jgi:hypothetical protein